MPPAQTSVQTELSSSTGCVTQGSYYTAHLLDLVP